MADYFVDSTTGDDGDSGLTMDLAWATLEHALESGGLTAGDTVWVRRIHVEAALSGHIDCAYDGTVDNPIIISGWPRNTASFTSATWTNGSTTVDNIVGLSLDKEQHIGRYVTAPDGNDYLITVITDADTFVIDREYPSPTVSGASGAATIKADENYATAQAIDDSGWTITVATWTADADDIATVDMQGGAFIIRLSSDIYHQFRNLYFYDANNSAGVINPASLGTQFIGCVFEQVIAQPIMFINLTNVFTYLERFIFIGAGSGGANRGLYSYSPFVAKNGAIYNMGDNGILSNYPCYSYMENVNIGIEAPNGDYDIALIGGSTLLGIDVALGGASGEVFMQSPSPVGFCGIENYNKVLGDHKAWNGHGSVAKTDVTEGSGDPYKRSGGADSVLELLYDNNDTSIYSTNALAHLTVPVFDHEFEVDDTSKNYRYYVQAEGAVAADEIWIELAYVSVYDDTSEYYMKRVISTDAISARSGANDWSQYLEINNIIPAVASKVRIKLFCRYYHASNKIYVDPQPRVT